MVKSQTNQIARPGHPDVIKRFVAAAAWLSSAACVCYLALRVGRAVGWHVYDLLSGCIARLKRMAEIGRDCIRPTSSKDVRFAVNVESRQRGAIERAQNACRRGIPTAAQMASVVSPGARRRGHAVPVPTRLTSTFMVGQILATIVARLEKARRRLQPCEAQEYGLRIFACFGHKVREPSDADACPKF
jgi:DNA-binding MurR/RpiR family transcriptional regulator